MSETIDLNKENTPGKLMARRIAGRPRLKASTITSCPSVPICMPRIFPREDRCGGTSPFLLIWHFTNCWRLMEKYQYRSGCFSRFTQRFPVIRGEKIGGPGELSNRYLLLSK